ERSVCLNAHRVGRRFIEGGRAFSLRLVVGGQVACPTFLIRKPALALSRLKWYEPRHEPLPSHSYRVGRAGGRRARVGAIPLCPAGHATASGSLVSRGTRARRPAASSGARRSIPPAVTGAAVPARRTAVRVGD